MEYIIETWLNEYLDQDNKYEYYLRKFINFIININKGDSPKQISINDIERYIIDDQKNIIKSENYVVLYLSAINQFSIYLHQTQGINFFSELPYDIFRKNLVNNNFFDKEKTHNLYTGKELAFLLQQFQNLLPTEFPHSIGKQKTYKHQYVAYMFFKLTLLLPTKKNIIYNIKIREFQHKYSKLNFDKILIDIPPLLQKEIMAGIDFQRNNQGIVTYDTNLLEYIADQKITPSSINEYFTNLIKKVVPYTDTEYPNITPNDTPEKIKDSAIQNMLVHRINPSIIAALNRNSICNLSNNYDIFELFFMDVPRNYQSDSTFSTQNEQEINSFINQEIKKTDYYKYL